MGEAWRCMHTRDRLPVICAALEKPRGSLPLPLDPSGTELCPSWHGTPGAGYRLCLWPGREWGWGALGSSVAGCCLGDQIPSQEAGGLARQSPGAQHWVPGGLEEVDGARNGVGTRVTPPKPHPNRDSEDLACCYVAVTCIRCSSPSRLMWIWRVCP